MSEDQKMREAAWKAYREQQLRFRRPSALRKRDFIAGWEASRMLHEQEAGG